MCTSLFYYCQSRLVVTHSFLVGPVLVSIVLCLFDMYRKDVRLPQQLQRAMAAEAEASREARAKVQLIGFSLSH